MASNEAYWLGRLSGQGSISAPKKSVGDKIEGAVVNVLGRLGLSQKEAQRVGKKVFRAVNDLTPVGNVTGAEEGGKQVYRGLKKGDLGQAALGAAIFGLSAAPAPRAMKKGAENFLGKLARDETGAIRAWHGSPHDFDKFSMDKIGTGEGAQAYGHGLYFAEEKAVADQYRTVLSNRSRATQDPASAAGFWIGMNNGDRDAAAKTFESIKAQNQRILDRVAQRLPVAPGAAGHALSEIQAADEALAHIVKGTEARAGGRLYEVNINAEPEDFLDWDKRLDQQAPNVLGKLGIDADDMTAQWTALSDAKDQIRAKYPSQSGLNDADLLAALQAPPSADPLYRQREEAERALMGMASDWAGRPDATIAEIAKRGNRSMRSDQLLKQGIPGIRYLDQGSRGAGNGTRNYVVFDDTLLDILGKY